MRNQEDPVRLAVIGHVDHGKSSLVGRLLHETGNLPTGKVEAIQGMCARRGMPFEWAFALDAFRVERDQGITIDTAQIRLKTRKRDIVVIDTPGHVEFLRNMVTGAASADAAMLVVDAAEGIQAQTRRHGQMIELLGLKQVAVAVNKMDLTGWSQARFDALAGESRDYLGSLGLDRGRIAVVPVSARDGDNLIAPSPRAAWYDGPPLLDAVSAFKSAVGADDLPLRFPVQDIYKFDERRILVGRVESGRFAVGDEVLFSPSNKTARIASIESWPGTGRVTRGAAGEAVGITLDQPLFIERGEVMSLPDSPPALTNELRARIFWLGKRPLQAGGRYRLKLNTAEHAVDVAAVDRAIDAGDLSESSGGAIARNAVAEVTLRSRKLIAADDFGANSRTGRFVLIEDTAIAGGGTIIMKDIADQRPRYAIKSAHVHTVEDAVALNDRWRAKGHKSGILWLTGLSGAGKTTLAFELERRLFGQGYDIYVLDGDNIRHGLSSDLGFAPEDRAENIRRVGEVAALFARAGVLVITAFISPYRTDRDRVRQIAPDLFHEVHIRAGVEACERRDPKGLYAKARRGEIPSFTGVSDPYEAPSAPDLVVDTEKLDVEASVGLLLDYIRRKFQVSERA